VGEAELEDIAVGAAILGTGGGGDPYIGKLLAQEAIRRYGPVQMVTVDEVPGDAFVVPSAMMGAPTVMVEKLPRGTEVIRAFKALGDYVGREPTHTTSIEAGGLNSTTPFVVAAQLGIPLVDADGMGRAFPEIQMIVATMHGVKATPMTLAETASTFCETIVRQAALGAADSEGERLQILEAALQTAFGVTVDILSRFLFESRLFEERLRRELSVTELNELMLQAQEETYGDAVDPELRHPYMWAVKPHYYSADRSFYNFPYTFGLLFGLGLYARYEDDPDEFRVVVEQVAVVHFETDQET